MNIPKELKIATKYNIFFDVLGSLLSSFSIGSTKPNIGETHIVPKVAAIPIWASSSSSSLNILNLSPIQVYNPAIMPVNPASGPILAPNINGNIEDTIDGKEGDKYTTERKPVDGYEASGKDPENATGEMIEGVIEVIYVYRKIPVDTSDINVGMYVVISLIAIVGIAGVIYFIVKKKVKGNK